uniref:Histidine triad n=1 Tax=uncultured microorganism TaxID=358574 RepID=K0J3S8_9ZZZZ|nr:histidine triad [uncultured microorganism]
MKEIRIAMNDELERKLGGRASELGLKLGEFLAEAIKRYADRLVRPKVWMPRESWDALVRGDNCPDCAHLASGENPHGYRITDLRVSRLDLMKNQFVPGCCVLYSHSHVVEPYHLSVEERVHYFEDLMRAVQTIAEVFRPIKLNYQILGNRGPHLHCHIQPRFYGDAEPGWPIDPYKEQVVLTRKEYEDRVRSIRKALEGKEGAV